MTKTPTKSTPIPIPQSTIDTIFTDLPAHPGAYIIPLFSLLLPPDTHYDDVQSFHDFPHASPDLSNYIWDKVIAFDRAHAFDHLPGGYWLNYGWTTDPTLPPWSATCPPFTKEATR